MLNSCKKNIHWITYFSKNIYVKYVPFSALGGPDRTVCDSGRLSNGVWLAELLPTGLCDYANEWMGFVMWLKMVNVVPKLLAESD